MDDQADQSVDTAQTWLVGAILDGVDHSEQFVREGIWEMVTPSPRDLAHVQTMKPGDRIAIKSTFTQKHGLPFDVNGHTVSVMRIKARGRITRALEGRFLVDWEPLEPHRDWYFYTNRYTIWRLPDEDFARQLEEFIFDGAPQDYSAFLSHPFWAERYRTAPVVQPPESASFSWIPFFVEVADALLEWRRRRRELAELVAQVRNRHGLSSWQDKFADGTSGPLRDIDPCTAMSVFNLGPTPWQKKKSIAQDFAESLGLDLLAPEHFTGVPITHPQQAWLYGWEKDRGDAIDLIWEVYEAGLAWADQPDDQTRKQHFARALSDALPHSTWMLLTGLYRARPTFFCPMDANTRGRLPSLIGVERPPHYSHEQAVTWYLDMLEKLHAHLATPEAEAHSIPELSDLIWQTGSITEPAPTLPDEPEEPGGEAETPYTLDDLVNDGCFIPRPDLERMVGVLERQKNIILQGAPGTGKTWLARRLAWVIAGRKGADNVQVVQFHPNTAYEDFVRGYRPVTDDAGVAGLKLVDGPFLRLSDRAHAYPEGVFTMVIEEINRGNPARALGELLTLLEASKRTKDDALRLTYERDVDGAGVWLPANLHTIGTMNIADRSLALVDVALRRRFAFFTLVPQFTKAWTQWVTERGFTHELASQVANGVTELNAKITADGGLGEAFVVGHSFFTPTDRLDSPEEWCIEQVESSIRPLLREYWFNDTDRADQHADALRSSWH